MSLARLEQDVLLAHVLGVSRAELYAYPVHRYRGDCLQ